MIEAYLVWLQFVVCIAVILVAGRNVARYGDIISERTGIGQVWMGVIAISLITSLPELFTGISSVTIVSAPNLTVGNLIGANAFNLFNLAVLDIIHRGNSIISLASPAHRPTGWFSLGLVVLVGLFIFISARFSAMSLGWIGWYTPIIIIFYLAAVWQIFTYEKKYRSMEPPGIFTGAMPMKKVYIYFIVSAVFIIGAGVWLATIGDEIAATTGWGQSFVGSLFLAFTTTLPEITVSFTAMRLGARDMAVANLIGSNLFNLTIIPVIDLIYTRGPILAEVSEANIVTAGVVAVMTVLFLAGLRFRPRRFLRLNWLNVSLVILFLASAYLSFVLA
jgi:cation:H+ antiporter